MTIRWGFIIAAATSAAAMTLFVRWYGSRCLHHWHPSGDDGPVWSCCWCPKIRRGRMPRSVGTLCFEAYKRRADARRQA